MKYATNRRINVRTIRNIKNNEGLTLRHGKIVEYKTGIIAYLCYYKKTEKSNTKSMEASQI